MMWHFYLPDEDRSAGWTNHCYVLQYVCSGVGTTAVAAWKQAKATDKVPEGFIEEGTLTAVRADHEVKVSLD